MLGGPELAARPFLNGVTLVFGSVDLQSDAGWAEMKASITELARALFPPPN